MHLLSGWNGVFPFFFFFCPYFTLLDMCIYMTMEFSLDILRTVQDYGLIIIRQSKYLLRYIHSTRRPLIHSCQHNIGSVAQHRIAIFISVKEI